MQGRDVPVEAIARVVGGRKEPADTYSGGTVQRRRVIGHGTIPAPGE